MKEAIKKGMFYCQEHPNRKIEGRLIWSFTVKGQKGEWDKLQKEKFQ